MNTVFLEVLAACPSSGANLRHGKDVDNAFVQINNRVSPHGINAAMKNVAVMREANMVVVRRPRGGIWQVCQTGEQK
jgi:hypothetical protein